MSFSIGITGLPNVGKSTLFKALTKQSVDISNYPFCTIEPNKGIVAVPDERLEKIAEIVKPRKITPTVIEFIDIAGLVKNAHQGEGLGSQFLAHIREVDAICQIVRVFDNEKISHVEGSPDPARDIEIINLELGIKDSETISKRLEKTKKQARTNDKKAIKELSLLNQIKKHLESSSPNKLGLEALKYGQELQLLTIKPMLYVFNTDDKKTIPQELKDITPQIKLDLQSELELSELTPEEAKELELAPSQLDRLIKVCYQALDLITFYTIAGGQEIRAWTLKRNSKMSQAGAAVHSDFEEKFIRAQAINWQKLIAAGTWHNAREKGMLDLEGKDYLVQDGDVIEFKI